jgi:hypothetical protein
MRLSALSRFIPQLGLNILHFQNVTLELALVVRLFFALESCEFLFPPHVLLCQWLDPFTAGARRSLIVLLKLVSECMHRTVDSFVLGQSELVSFYDAGVAVRLLLIEVPHWAPVIIVLLSLLVCGDPSQVPSVLAVLLGGFIVAHRLLPGFNPHVLVLDLLKFFARVIFYLLCLFIGFALLIFLNLEFPLEISYDLLTDLLLSLKNNFKLLVSDASRAQVPILKVAARHDGRVDIRRAFRR